MQVATAVAAVPQRALRSSFIVLGLIIVVVFSAMLGLASPARGATSGTRATSSTAAAPTAALKAVIVVGPTHGLTSNFLERGEVIAKAAESYGMDVRRVYHPHATVERVLANVQGANLLVYLGHGNGWPSPYGPFQEKTKNGMGLNTVDGGSTSNVTYYGANWLRNNVVLAPNAVVLLNGLCYSAGNAEPGMAIPNWDIAHQRVDNFAAGFLGAGAKAVFAYAWQSGAHVVKMLFTTNKTMEQIFTTPGAYPHPSYGFINWDARRLTSVRTPGTVNYLDPHAKEGFYRAASGSLSMTASEWKGGQAQVDPEPPVLSDLEAVGAQTTVALQGTTPALFTPNGDGLSDNLVMSHTVSEGAFIDFEVVNGSGTVVRRFTTWSEAGSGRSSWNGKKDNGTYVADGNFTVKATPRDGGGNVGDAATLDVQVLTTMRAPTAAPALFFARDGDALAPSAALGVTLTTNATLSWKVVDRDGNLVRRHLDAAPTSAGPQSWTWDGRNELGEFVPDGTYFSVVTANTSAGKYSHKVAVQTGAFGITSPVASASRGQKVKFVIFSAEPLASRPRLRVTQPGLATYTVDTVKVATQKYRAVFTFKSGGTAGTVQLVAVAPDVNGVKQSTAATFPLN